VLSFAFQLDNGIPILPYYEGSTDCELKFLVKYLNHLSKVKDIRVENSKLMQLDSLLKKLEDRKSNFGSNYIETESKYSLSLQFEEDVKEYKFLFSEDTMTENHIVFSCEDHIRKSSDQFRKSSDALLRKGSFNYTPRSSKLSSSIDKLSFIKEDINFVWSDFKNIFK